MREATLPSARQTAASIDAFLRTQGSPLAGLGAQFVKSGARWNVDPYLMVAIAGAETHFGTTGNASAIHNPFGWGPHIKFSSWASAIETVTKGLRNGYLNEGRTSISGIQEKWAPVGAGNDPTNLNSNWTTNVTRWYKELSGNNFAGGRAGGRAKKRNLFPVQGGGTISSVWHDSRDGGSRLHKGIDVAADEGTPLIAVADGTIALRTGGAGGNAVWIDGTYYYAHLHSFNVEDGQQVKAGDVIGFVGNTGTSTGPHLHFGYDPSGTFGQNWVNPVDLLNSLKTQTVTSAADAESQPGAGDDHQHDVAGFWSPPQGPLDATLPHQQRQPPDVGMPGLSGVEPVVRPPLWDAVESLDEISQETRNYLDLAS